MTVRRFDRTRRTFLGGTAGFALLCGRIGASQAVGGVRKNAKNLTEAEWATFERGVLVMKQIDRKSPVSWWFQANIHGVPPDEPPPLFQGWKTCQHGNWWFLPWHRAYLLYFERILRRYSGDPGFMLPYWDWTQPDQRSLPPRFLDPSSPLYDGTRDPDVNGGGPIDEYAVSWPVVAEKMIFSTTVGGLGCFGGKWETTPGMGGDHGAMEALCHDLVHDSIGGLMGNPATAARDPIFWMHHANVDRLWSAWLKAGGGVRLPRDPYWLNTAFTFYGPLGRAGVVAASQLLNTTALGYRYEDYPAMPIGAVAVAAAPVADIQEGVRPPVAAAPEKKTVIAAATPPRNELTSEPLSVTFATNAEGRRRIEEASRAVMQAPTPGEAGDARPPRQKLQVVIDDIRFAKSPGRFYEVYVNLPRTADAVGPTSPYYAGSVSFFALLSGHGGNGHAMGGATAGKTAVVDVTEAVARLRAAGKLGGDVKITLIERSTKPRRGAVPTAGPKPKVTIGEIRLLHSGD